MNYNPEIHHRRSIRLKDYDYSQSGAYFITICCENKLHRFGEIQKGQPQGIEHTFNEIKKNNDIVRAGLAPALFSNTKNINENQQQYNNPKMKLNEYGQIAYNEWIKLSDRFQNFELNVFQIMPNHMHGIIVLNHSEARTVPARLTNKPTISDIIGAYKSLVANACLNIYKTRNEIMGKLWQRNYYEHIIRNEKSFEKIYQYIINNPSKWQEDKFYTK